MPSVIALLRPEAWLTGLSSKFKHYYPDLEDWLLVGHERRATSKDALDHLEWYCDPFYNECRAYGRLMESRLNGKAAVRCYGYMMLPDKYEQELKRRFGAGDWQRPSNEYEVPFSQRQNLRAIVKDMVFEQTDWTTGVKKKLGDLRRIHKRKVYVRDIKEENYVGGLLVDFSIALTEPRFMFDIKDPKWTHIEKSSERVAGEHVL
ncbi:MAG: hypothetical protein LQ350_006002 [Teloschistes chrysophthalmus]|nr:MAG: hypothetical protein LQ350_006002 [Niorma chrysophthalma]